MKQLTIAIDCDNILNNLCETVLKIYNEEWEDNLSLSDITSYNIENFVKPAAKENFYKIFLRKEVWKQISVITDSIYYINKLKEKGHRIIIVTKTEPKNCDGKARWIEKNYALAARKCLFLCPDKKLIKADVLIDDCLDNFGGQKYSICLDYPWNKEFKTDSNNFRCKNWKEIYEVIKNIEKED